MVTVRATDARTARQAAKIVRGNGASRAEEGTAKGTKRGPEKAAETRGGTEVRARRARALSLIHI